MYGTPLGSAVIGSRAPTVRSLRTLLVLFYSSLYHQSFVVHICTCSCRSVAHLRNYLPSTANVTDPCTRIFSRLKFGHYQLRRRRPEQCVRVVAATDHEGPTDD